MSSADLMFERALKLLAHNSILAAAVLSAPKVIIVHSENKHLVGHLWRSLSL
jgi:hypothetical protein